MSLLFEDIMIRDKSMLLELLWFTNAIKTHILYI